MTDRTLLRVPRPRAVARVIAAIALAASLTTRPGAASDLKEECAEAAERAQALMRAGKLGEARPELVSCAREACPRVVRTDCGPWLVDLDRMMPSIVVRAHDERGKDVMGVRVVVDGRVVAERLDGSALTIDPGEHQLRYVVRGADAVAERVLVAQGEKNRVLSVGFRGALSPDGSRDVAPAGAPRTSGAPVGAYVSGAVGVLALGAFTGFELSAQQDKARLDDGCGQTGTCGSSDVDRVRTKFVVAGISLGVGLAALGVATLLFFLDRAHPSPTRAAQSEGPALLRF